MTSALRLIFFVSLVLTLAVQSFAETREDDRDQHILVEAKFRRWRAETPFGSYRPRKTRVLSLMHGYTGPDDGKLCEWSGRADVALGATGFFRTEKVAERWWLVDPHGHPFVATSLNSIRSGQRKDRNPTSRASFSERWKSEGDWAEDARRFLVDSGFNTVGAWSDSSLRKVNRPLPWTTVLYVMYPFGAQRGGKSDESNMKFPNDCMPIFDPEFERFCKARLAEVITQDLIEDRMLVGYFVDNELPWREDALDRYLKIDTSDVNYRQSLRWLIQRKGLDHSVSPETVLKMIDDDDRSGFLGYISERYFSMVYQALRVSDPNHLYLGSRLHGQALRLEPLFHALGQYADVVSINYYNRWTPRTSELENWTAWSGDKPFLISEWYAKGEDSGQENVQGADMVVRSQMDRGRFYQNFLLRLLESKHCVGSFWHTYRDADELPKGSNKGFMSVTFEPFEDLVMMAAEINRQKYSLIDYFDR
jgi:hypothetical protein